MHPAYSVIFFTTASGAGYGLLAWLAIASAMRGAPPSWMFGLIGMGLALLLITGGLLSSTSHLGRPERAWRAFSQWRSSWLSREGVLAVATYIPAGILGIAWVFFEKIDGATVFVSLLTAALAMATVYCTGMIYASLPTIRDWHHPLTVPNYMALSVASGAVLFVLVLSIFKPLPQWLLVLGLISIAAAWLLKRSYWSGIDSLKRNVTPETATGLGHIGKVRPLEPPHAQANYIMREMGYSVARKHADKLRSLAAYLTFLVPAVCLALLFIVSPSVAVLFALIATGAMAVGLFIERWLFFAEAEHVVMTYYGRDAA